MTDRSVIMVDNSIKTAADCQVSTQQNSALTKLTNWLMDIKMDNLRKASTF